MTLPGPASCRFACGGATADLSEQELQLRGSSGFSPLSLFLFSLLSGKAAGLEFKV